MTSLDLSNSPSLTELWAYDCVSLTSITLGNNIDLTALAPNFKTQAGSASLVIHVGNGAGRVALAQSLFTQITVGTTFAI